MAGGGGCCNGPVMVLFPSGTMLSTEATYLNQRESDEIEVVGDDLAVAGTIEAATGTNPNLSIQFWGSVDGRWWQAVGAPIARATGVGPMFGNINNIQFKFLKAIATFTNSAGTGNMLFGLSVYTRMSA